MDYNVVRGTGGYVAAYTATKLYTRYCEVANMPIDR